MFCLRSKSQMSQEQQLFWELEMLHFLFEMESLKCAANYVPNQIGCNQVGVLFLMIILENIAGSSN